MKTRWNGWVRCLALAAGLAIGGAAQAFPVLGAWDFDGDTAGNYPAGWTHNGASTNTFVVNGVSNTPSLPNVFQLEHTGAATHDFGTFTPFSYSSTLPNVVLSYDLKVPFAALNDGSSGFLLFLSSPLSGFTVASPRIFGSNSTWTLFNPYAGISGGSFTPATGLQYDRWYHLDFVINPSSTTQSTAQWYLDGVLINTETANTMSTAATQNVNRFNVQAVTNTAVTTRIYLDNVQVALPEPASAALLAGGVALILRRRNGN